MKRTAMNLNHSDSTTLAEEHAPLLSRKNELSVPSAEDFDPVILRAKIDDVKLKLEEKHLPNYNRRFHYAESELIIMDLERVFKDKENYHLNEKEMKLKDCLEDLLIISKQLKLLYAPHYYQKSFLNYIFYKIDEVHRSIAVFLSFIFFGLFITLPSILLCLRSIDILLIKMGFTNAFYQMSNSLKTLTARFIIRCAGVEILTENLDYSHFGKDCSLITFSHSSTIDAFVISVAIPVRHYTLVSWGEKNLLSSFCVLFI
jgi:hypothetical protein